MAPPDLKSDRPTSRAAVRRHRIFPVLLLAGLLGCSRERPAPPPTLPREAPRAAVVETPTRLEATTPYRASLGHGAVLYLPPWFRGKAGGYDLVVHFHGEGRWQEANVDHAKLDAAVVSVNLGAGTDAYDRGFRDPDAFEHLLDATHAEVVKSGRADGAELRRIALTAWSAGFSAVSRVLTDAVARRVDALLLADGFFTFFSDPKRRVVNERGLERFARFAEAAGRDEKLFAITHTTIPTGPYPSVQECTAKLLEMLACPKASVTLVGPRGMRAFYTVDKGSFHVRGFTGETAGDHIKQLHAMGETMYPYLRERWADRGVAARQ